MGNYNIVSAASLVAGQPEDVSPILANFQAIAAVLNGGIDDSNIAATAGISLAKTSPKVTTSTLAGGPPALPNNGDIWIATVGANGERWAFQYSSGSASAYKWEFIGGTEIYTTVGAFGGIVADNTWKNSSMGIVATRAGDYRVRYINTSYNTTAVSGNMFVNFSQGTTASIVPASVMGGQINFSAAAQMLQLTADTPILGVVAGNTIWEIYQAATGLVAQIGNRILSIRPIRII